MNDKFSCKILFPHLNGGFSVKKMATLLIATFLLLFMSFPVSAEIISKNNLPELVDEISKLDLKILTMKILLICPIK